MLAWRGISLGLAWVMLGTALMGCQSASEEPLPPATVMGPVPRSAPRVEPTPTLQATVTPSTNPEPTPAPAGGQAITVTILHTNDVAGAINPCG